MLTETRQTRLDEVISLADKLCVNLDRMANNELAHCAELQQQFDIWSWEALRMVNNLKHVKEMI